MQSKHRLLVTGLLCSPHPPGDTCFPWLSWATRDVPWMESDYVDDRSSAAGSAVEFRHLDPHNVDTLIPMKSLANRVQIQLHC